MTCVFGFGQCLAAFCEADATKRAFVLPKVSSNIVTNLYDEQHIKFEGSGGTPDPNKENNLQRKWFSRSLAQIGQTSRETRGWTDHLVFSKDLFLIF